MGLGLGMIKVMGQYRMVRYLHCIHHKAPQWSASLPQRFCNAPQWSASVQQYTATHRGLSVCRSAFGILAKRLSGSRAVGDGGWVGPGIGVLNFGGNRRRGRGSFGRGKFGNFHCNQWDCLGEGRWCGSSQITLGFSSYDKAHRAVIFAIAQLSCFI